MPKGQGIAGQVAATGQALNIPDAYAHPLFNQEVDQKTGFRTRNILCIPMRDSEGTTIGVTQVINKKSGPFTEADERILASLSSQAAVALDNAQLYERVRGMKAYLESIVGSLSNGVVTIDAKRRITTANRSALGVLRRGRGGAARQRRGSDAGEGQRGHPRDRAARAGLRERLAAVRRRLHDARRQGRVDEPERGPPGRPERHQDGRRAGARRHHRARSA